jgi:type I restriction enzyme S subunit
VTGPGFVVGRATNLGVPTWSAEDYWPLNTTLYAADFKGNDPKFLYYLFETLDLTGYDSGSVQPMLNRNYIAAVEVLMPDALTQGAIVAVLGALDDKIAANMLVVRLAIELADAQFLRAASGVTSAERTFADVAEVGGGGTPRTSMEEFWNGPVGWATPTDVTALAAPYLTTTSRMITEAGLAACASSLYPQGSILMTSRATIGAFALAQVPVAVNQGFIVVNARQPELQFWLFHEMRSRVDEFLSHANGATFLELSRGRFKQLGVRVPDMAAARSFAARVGPLHEVAAQLLRETTTLVRTRDQLLPLLMSSKVRVKDAEKLAEEVL